MLLVIIVYLIVIAIDDIIYHIVLPVFYDFFGKSRDLGFLPVADRSMLMFLNVHVVPVTYR